MSYENSVYLAKLAEQAERYEGKRPSSGMQISRLTASQRWSRT